jgi:hypothetical protein
MPFKLAAGKKMLGPWINNDGGLYACVVSWRLRRDLAIPQLLANAEFRPCTTWQILAKIRVATGNNGPGIAAHRKSEKTNAVTIEPRRTCPTAEHEIDQPLDVRWPLDEGRQVVDAALV